MRFHFFLLFVLAFSTSFGQLKRTLFNDNWEFQAKPSDPVSIVSLPHTPQLEPLVMNGQFIGEVVYRKRFDYQLQKGRRLLLHFEGAMHTASVALNGQLIGSHVGGYLPFEVDLTEALLDSANVLEVYLDNREDPTIPPGKAIKELDFYYHAGIYRNVWLEEVDDIQIQYPYFQTIDANTSAAILQLDFELAYQSDWINLPLQVSGGKIGRAYIHTDQYIIH
ncbi:MAG: hypothetical protein RL440_2038 [Bacteroidota bacterium]